MATMCVLTAVGLENSIKRTVLLLSISVFTRICAFFHSPTETRGKQPETCGCRPPPPCDRL